LANDNIANVLTSYASSNPSQAMLTPTDNRMAVYKKVITPSKSNPYENGTYPLSQPDGGQKVHKTEGVAGNVGKTLGYIKIHAEGFAKYGNSQSTPHNADSFGDDPSAAVDVNGALLSAAPPLYQAIERVQIWCQEPVPARKHTMCGRSYLTMPYLVYLHTQCHSTRQGWWFATCNHTASGRANPPCVNS
jgi:hypothetical protein